MIELAAENSGGLYRRGVAGDSYNTAIYLSRAGLQVSYLTRLGDDALSDGIIAHLADEGIGDALIERVARRRPGLYLIDNDAQGERHFHYWRDHAPVRELFAQPLRLPAIDVFYFTGITLAVTRPGLAQLIALLVDLRARGCRIVSCSTQTTAPHCGTTFSRPGSTAPRYCRCATWSCRRSAMTRRCGIATALPTLARITSNTALRKL
ncbi:MAG: hypothetical protein IPG06_15490 [Haliea sp.]|nr:hypothetical protein [Haliea sp.]